VRELKLLLRARCFKYLERSRNHLFADAVARNHRDPEFLVHVLKISEERFSFEAA
jgi:hypothetical protein